MTIQNQNYDMYFPVQVWISTSGRFRLEPPLLGTRDTYEFAPFFWHNVAPNEKPRLEKEWRLWRTFWAFNPKSVLMMNRGLNSITIQQRTSFPYDSMSFTTTTDPFQIFDSENQHSLFSFIVYIVKIPTSWLLFLKKQNDLLEIRFCHPTEGCQYESDFPFLPSFEAKKISCYDLHGDKEGFFCYIFDTRPCGRYFECTSENLCIPSNNSRDFPCFFDCMKASLVPRVLSDNTYTLSSNRALQTVMYTFPKVSSSSPLERLDFIAVILGFFMTCIFLISVSQQIQ
jgi:hypothetical protein